jgi:hypothetical protein
VHSQSALRGTGLTLDFYMVPGPDLPTMPTTA